MEDRDFRSWNITAEQADRIASGDIEERNAFYFANKERFTQMAYNYISIHNQKNTFYRYNVEDMVSQLYLDLPYLNWQNALQLTMSIKQISFAWSAYGGYAQRKEQGLPCSHKFAPWEWYPDNISLDVKLYDDDEPETMQDAVASYEYNPCTELLRKEEAKRALKISQIVNACKDFLNEKYQKILALFLDGYSFAEINEHVDGGSCGLYRCKEKLILNYTDILRRIYLERKPPSYILGIAPDDYKILVAKRDADNARRREKKARKVREEGRTVRAPRRKFATEEERRAAYLEYQREYSKTHSKNATDKEGIYKKRRDMSAQNKSKKGVKK